MIIEYSFFDWYLDEQEMQEYDRNWAIYEAIDDLERMYNEKITLRYFVSPLSRNPDSMVLDFECLCSDKTLEYKLSQLLEGRFLIPVVFRKDLLEKDRAKAEIWGTLKKHKSPIS